MQRKRGVKLLKVRFALMQKGPCGIMDYKNEVIEFLQYERADWDKDSREMIRECIRLHPDWLVRAAFPLPAST